MFYSKEEMWIEVCMKLDVLYKKYVESLRYIIQVDYFNYMDELFKLNGNFLYLGIL